MIIQKVLSLLTLEEDIFGYLWAKLTFLGLFFWRRLFPHLFE